MISDSGQISVNTKQASDETHHQYVHISVIRIMITEVAVLSQPMIIDSQRSADNDNSGSADECLLSIKKYINDINSGLD